jgi:hypothetical protein
MGSAQSSAATNEIQKYRPAGCQNLHGQMLSTEKMASIPWNYVQLGKNAKTYLYTCDIFFVIPESIQPHTPPISTVPVGTQFSVSYATW